MKIGIVVVVLLVTFVLVVILAAGRMKGLFGRMKGLFGRIEGLFGRIEGLFLSLPMVIFISLPMLRYGGRVQRQHISETKLKQHGNEKAEANHNLH